MYNAQLGYAVSYVNNSSLPITENLHGQPSQLSAQSANLDITMLSILGFSQTILVTHVSGMEETGFTDLRGCYTFVSG
jgi:hypothetical protein